ncbi:MAG TPA: MBOAT family O-acyltransferase [Anaerolineales bacterium]|nr:MBOAT family O-acyltransferase [Anaerolineales bacterium]
MLFPSTTFFIFFPLVYGLYLWLQNPMWGKNRLRWQNGMLFVASCLFYGWWDWRFLLMLLATTALDYWVSLKIHASDQPTIRKRYLALSIITNLGLLGFFKYFNFFQSSFTQLLNLLGMQASPFLLTIVLPVGISFYVFQSISYVVDVYRNELEPPDNYWDFGLFVSLFPQLVAGPIMRATELLPQVLKPRRIDVQQVNAAVFLILWGYFKKVAIADNVGVLVERVFNNWQAMRGMDVALGILAFTLQIYCDFSGYTDIARGISKLMGFELMLNFRLPYFARSPQDFWNRWHISLSTWLRDYLYIPLGGNRQGEWKTYRNLLLTMLLGGLWHGASWNFVLWGLYHGLLLVLHRLCKPFLPRWDRLPGWRGFAIRTSQILAMFALTCLGWLLFRAHTFAQINGMLLGLFDSTGWSIGALTGSLRYAAELAFLGAPLLVIQLWQARKQDLLAPTHAPTALRLALYSALFIGAILLRRDSLEFIYFQF